MNAAITLTTDNFESEVLNSDVPVIVDFWADWCVPCKLIAPILEELATEHAGKLKIGKVDVDDQRDIGSKYNIMSIPSLLVFKDGQVVKQHVGAAPKATLEDLISGYL